MQNKIFMIGFFKETYEFARNCGFNVIGTVVTEYSTNDYPIPVLGKEEKLDDFIASFNEYPALLTPDQPDVRCKLYHLYKKFGVAFSVVKSPSATIHDSVLIGEGCMIHNQAHLSVDVKIGKLVRVNVMANLMHDVTVGDFSTIAPNACVLGNVKIGSRCYIGANSTILPGLHIGDGAIVGAGSVVTRDVAAHSVVAGNPARLLRSIEAH